MSETTTNPRIATPRAVGTWRLVGRVQPGWWVHLEPCPGAPEGTRGEWAQVSWYMDTNRGNRTLVFTEDATDGDGNSITSHKNDQAVTLTEREAKKYGLVGKNG